MASIYRPMGVYIHHPNTHADFWSVQPLYVRAERSKISTCLRTWEIIIGVKL